MAMFGDYWEPMTCMENAILIEMQQRREQESKEGDSEKNEQQE